MIDRTTEKLLTSIEEINAQIKELNKKKLNLMHNMRPILVTFGLAI